MVYHVLYHCPCADGAYGALAAHLFFEKMIKKGTVQRKDVIYTPHSTYANPDSIAALLNAFKKTDIVYLIDYTGKKGFLQASCKRAAKVITLDHHKTGQEEVDEMQDHFPENLEAHYSKAQSGATIAWDYFSSQLLESETLFPDHFNEKAAKHLKKIYSLIEDHDLWLHKLPGSREFAAGFSNLRLDFNYGTNPRIFKMLLAVSKNFLMCTGGQILREQEPDITRILKRKFVLDFSTETEKIRCLAVENQDFELINVLGERLTESSWERKDVEWFGAVCSNSSEAKKISFRGIGENFDTSQLAKRFGGGGHHDASGCHISYAMFESMKKPLEDN